MIFLQDYQIEEQVGEGVSSLVYRGRDSQENLRIFKLLKEEYPSPEQIARFRSEYQILQKLKNSSSKLKEGVIQAYNLLQYRQSLVMVLEDIKGVSLVQHLLSGKKIIQDSLEKRLVLLIQMASILEQVHHNDIMHKALNPSNFIWSPERNLLKLIGFGNASEISKENSFLLTETQDPFFLKESLPYLSPEQTGRMNRSIDYRADLYSLGVIFYQLLTGRFPYQDPSEDSISFQNQDPMEMIHAHIAKAPFPLELSNKEKIPPSLAHIVLKLIEKNAEDRYQSCFGVKVDLQQCLESLPKYSNFEVAKQDYSSRLQIPQKLYGREKDLLTLLQIFRRIKQQTLPEIVLISGYSGIGKTSLIRGFHKELFCIGKGNGYFISGKFDQFRRNVPYFALTEALRDLIRQILSEKKDSLAFWKEKLSQNLQGRGGAILSLIPEAEPLLEKQEIPISKESTVENISIAREDLQVFQDFVGTFAQVDYPLILFLDDLQWIDIDTLLWLEKMMEAKDKALFVIGAYRDKESKENPLFQQTLSEFQSSPFFNHISLSPLPLSHVEQLICDCLRQKEGFLPLSPQEKELAQLIFQKTRGNPFFMGQFIESLYQENLLYFDHKQRTWKWDLQKIQEEEITQNVVDFMMARLKKLSLATQNSLSLASCIGNHFDQKTLIILEKEKEQEWKEALQAGVIFRSNSNQQSYRFLHDRVQQAAYNLLPEEKRKELHLKIGKLLLANQTEELIFETAHHFNLAKTLLSSPQEKKELAQFNLKAGKKAKSSNAYKASFQYLEFGLSLFPQAWDTEYELVLSLHREAVSTAYLSRNLKQMKLLAEEVLQYARGMEEKMEVYYLLIQSYGEQGLGVESIQLGFRLLDSLGLHIPWGRENSEDNNLNLEKEQEKLKQLLQQNSHFKTEGIEGLIHLPEVKDPKILASMEILTRIAPTSTGFSSDLFHFITLQRVQLSIKYGNASFSVDAYTDYAFLLSENSLFLDNSSAFASLALLLLEKFPDPKMKVAVVSTFYSSIFPLKNSLSKTVPFLKKNYQTGIAIGEIDFASYNLLAAFLYSFYSGQNLNSLSQEAFQTISTFQNLKFERLIQETQQTWQFLLNLKGDPFSKEKEIKYLDPCLLIGEQFDEKLIYPTWIKKKQILNLRDGYALKCILCYWFDRTEEAIENWEQSKKYGSVVNIVFFFHQFYFSLLRLRKISPAIHRNQKKLKKDIDFQAVEKEQAKIKIRVEAAPMNWMQKWLLVEAERYRILGEDQKASKTYQESIQWARKNKMIHEEALAYELYSRFWLERKESNEEVSHVYLSKAIHSYQIWGAMAKVRHLEQNKASFQSNGINHPKYQSHSHSQNQVIGLDLITVTKTSQAISSEIVFEKLLKTMMKNIIENMGAVRGILFLEKEGEWWLEAEGEISTETQIQPILLEEIQENQNRLCKSMILYTIRSEEVLVLQDAMHEGDFTTDPYILQNQSKSILCFPILYQKKLTGIFYFENVLAIGAFTQSRLQLLHLLSSQIVISLENARLYEEKTRLYEEKNRLYEEQIEKNQLLEKAQQELIESQSQLIQSEKMASLGTLVSGVAHEINNPTNFVNTSSYMMEKTLKEFQKSLFQSLGENPDEEIVQFLNKHFDQLSQSSKGAQEGCKRILEIVKHLRTFSRMDQVSLDQSEREEQREQLKTAKLIEGLQSTLFLIRPQYQEQVDFITEFQADPEIQCLPNQLNQVFMNMMVNACHAIVEQVEKKKEEDEKKGTLTIRTFLIKEEQQNYLAVVFEDTGCGMPKKVQEKMFDPFFTTKQGEAGKKDKGGTGLGLSITYSIMEKHGGKIKVTSEVDQGTQITLLFPLETSTS